LDLSVTSIAVLMTSFNQSERTVKALASLYAQRKSVARRMQVFLADDGSSDGTRGAVGHVD
jgi:GT2 family glycosyltransferase